MPLYDETDTEFKALVHDFRWFGNVLFYEYGEAEAPEDIPRELNWVRLLPLEWQLGLDDADCSLAYVSPSGDYRCTVWDVSGPDDLPWCVFIADDLGPRFLAEYSLLADEAEDAELEAILDRATSQVPDRLEAGDFNRTGTPLSVPAWLLDFAEDEV